MSPENSRFWLQQYARGGNGAKGEAEGRGTGWKQVGKEGAAAGGGTERLRKDGVDSCRTYPYVGPGAL